MNRRAKLHWMQSHSTLDIWRFEDNHQTCLRGRPISAAQLPLEMPLMTSSERRRKVHRRAKWMSWTAHQRYSESCTITKVGLLSLKSPYTRIPTKNSAAAPTPGKFHVFNRDKHSRCLCLRPRFWHHNQIELIFTRWWTPTEDRLKHKAMVTRWVK